MATGPATYAYHVANGLVRELWPDENLIEEIINEDPLLGMCEKETDWGYAVVHHPLGWGGNQGIGRKYSDAKRFKSTAQEAEFQIATREMFASLSLEGKLLRTFEFTKKRALLVDPVKREGERTIERMKRRFSRGIHGDGSGKIGKIKAGSDITTDTITLESPNDLKNFEQDTPFNVGDAADGTSLLDGGADARVLSIGTEDSPTVTLSVPWDEAFPSLTSGIVTSGAWLFGAGTADDDYIYGMEAFNPSYVAPGPGTFLTCDRNRNPGWLGGRLMKGKNLSIYQCIWKSARLSFDAGGKPNAYVLSSRRFEKLMFEFDNKLVLTKFPAADVGKYKMGVDYQGVEIAGPRGPIKVLPSIWAPDEIDRCGEIETLVMGSIGPLVHWDTGNGMSEMRVEDASDSRELRAVSDPAFLNKAPGKWVRVDTTA